MFAISAMHLLLMSGESSFCLNMLTEGQPRRLQNLRRKVHRLTTHLHTMATTHPLGTLMDQSLTTKLSEDKPPIDEAIDPHSSAGIKLTENRPQIKEVWFAGTHSDM
jgi:hypothetical protein